MSSIVGHWQAAGTEFSVVERDGVYVMTTPETPHGYEPRLIEREMDWMIVGGPYSGAEIRLEGEDAGNIGGTWDMTRLDRPPLPIPGDGQLAPALPADADRDVHFGRLWTGDGRKGLLDVSPYSTTHFVQWLMQRDDVIFHGSGKTDIEEFRPIRSSMELNDSTGRGNLGATYGTIDGLWAMFFAIVDRGQLIGSIRNGIADYTNEHGHTVRLYRFSIHHELIATEPYRHGALYILPRERFERIPYYPAGPLSEEWACFDAVTPIAKLLVSPADFPFLETIGGHDDSEIIAFGDLGDQVWGGMTAASRHGEYIRLVTSTDRSTIDEFVRMSGQFYPQVERHVSEVAGGHAIDMKGPAAFMQGIEERLAEHLI